MAYVRWVAVVSNGVQRITVSNSVPWRAAVEGAARLMYYTKHRGMAGLTVMLTRFEDEVEFEFQKMDVSLRDYMTSLAEHQLKDAINAVAWLMGSTDQGRGVIAELNMIVEKMNAR